MKIPKIILTRPKLVVDTKCPKCNSIDIAGLPIVDTQCKNCKTKFTTNAQINIYFSIAKKLLQLISNNNEVWVLGLRDVSKIFHPDNELRPRSRHEDDIYQTMLAIQHNFESQRCYDVEGINNEYDEQDKVYCNDCGICYNCFTCLKCGATYVPKTVDTKQGVEKRYKCPKCESRNYKRTQIKKIGKECPHCKSKNIKNTLLRQTKKECHRCKGKNISKPIVVPVYKLVIKRQKRFMKEE